MISAKEVREKFKNNIYDKIMISCEEQMYEAIKYNMDSLMCEIFIPPDSNRDQLKPHVNRVKKELKFLGYNVKTYIKPSLNVIQICLEW